MRARIAIAFLLTMMVLGACRTGGSRPPFEAPAVSLRDVRVAGIGIRGGSLDLMLMVYNPNPYPLQRPRVKYRVQVESHKLAEGLFDTDLVLAAQDSALVRVPASVGYVAAGRAGRALLGRGAAEYRVRGDITVGTPYGRHKFPYDRAGSYAPLRLLAGD